MHLKRFAEFFERCRGQGAPVVLATVVETRGSTYSKAGERMLIDEHGIYQGMISGGCLEGDLAIRAAAVVESGNARLVTYDLSDDDDELWGLGAGCEGLIRVMLQLVTAANGYEPLATFVDVMRGLLPAQSAIVVESDAWPVGATVIRQDANVLSAVATDELHEQLFELASGAEGLISVEHDGGASTVLLTAIEPPPSLLVLGAGADAEPVVRLASELSWATTVADHRPAYIDNGNFDAARATICLPVDELHRSVKLDDFDFAIVMSHHLASDRAYLEQLAASTVPYIGLLGPVARRDRLLEEIGEPAAQLVERLHGPAGIDIGGRGPAAIALSIISEMQEAYSSGREITR